MTLLSKTASIIYNSVQHNADHTHALKHSATITFCYIWPNICLNPGMLHCGLARWLHFMLFSLFRLSNQEHWQQKIRLFRKTEIKNSISYNYFLSKAAKMFSFVWTIYNYKFGERPSYG